MKVFHRVAMRRGLRLVMELRPFPAATHGRGGGLPAGRGHGDSVEPACADLALVAGRRIALRLEGEFRLLQLRIGGHAARELILETTPAAPASIIAHIRSEAFSGPPKPASVSVMIGAIQWTDRSPSMTAIWSAQRSALLMRRMTIGRSRWPPAGRNHARSMSLPWDANSRMPARSSMPTGSISSRRWSASASATGSATGRIAAAAPFRP